MLEDNLIPDQSLRPSDRQLKGVKPGPKDYVLTEGCGLQLPVRSNGSLLWNFNYREPVTKKRINIGFGTYPELLLAIANLVRGHGKNLFTRQATFKRHRLRGATAGFAAGIREDTLKPTKLKNFIEK